MHKKNQTPKEEFWSQHVDRFHQYQGSLKQYCQEQDISPSSIQYWIRKLSQDQRPTTSSFLPVVVSPRHKSFPDPKWLAEFIFTLQEMK